MTVPLCRMHAWCYRTEVGNNHLGRWRNITSHLPAAPRSAGCVQYTAHPGHGHTQHSIITRSRSILSSRTHYVTITESTESRDERHALSTAMHWRCARRGPGRATADGRRRPRTPHRPRPAPSPRAAGACATPLPTPLPTSNPLFTDGRPVSGAFVLPAASRRSFKFNALPMSGL